MTATLRRIFPYEAGGAAGGTETISNQAHDVVTPYSIDHGDNVTIEADYTGTENLIIEANGKFFSLPIVANSGEVTISSRLIGIGTEITITVHGPLASSKDCANPITIVSTEIDNDIRQIVKDFIKEHFSVDDWTTRVNESWWEESHAKEFQIFLLTDNKRGIAGTDYIQETLDRKTSGIRYNTTVFVYVSAPTEDGRWTLTKEMKSIFADTAISRDYVSGVDEMYIEQSWPLDKDCKQECPAWWRVFEVKVLW